MRGGARDRRSEGAHQVHRTAQARFALLLGTELRAGARPPRPRHQSMEFRAQGNRRLASGQGHPCNQSQLRLRRLRSRSRAAGHCPTLATDGMTNRLVQGRGTQAGDQKADENPRTTWVERETSPASRAMRAVRPSRRSCEMPI